MREDKLPNTTIPLTYVHTLVVGSGASGLAAAVRAHGGLIFVLIAAIC